MTKTKRQLMGCKVNEKVRRRILFHNVLVAQIKNNLVKTVTERHKRTVSQVVSGELLKSIEC